MNHLNPNPSVEQLRRHEQDLAQEILRAGGRPTITLPHGDGLGAARREQVAAPTPAPRLAANDSLPTPETALILGINLEDGVVETTFGAFQLSKLEMAQAALTAVNTIRRNLEAITQALEGKHGVTALKKVVADVQARAVEEMGRGQREAPPEPPSPEAPSAPAGQGAIADIDPDDDDPRASLPGAVPSARRKPRKRQAS